MQDATTVLGIIRNRGERGLPLKNLYRQLYNPQFYFQAYVLYWLLSTSVQKYAPLREKILLTLLANRGGLV